MSTHAYHAGGVLALELDEASPWWRLTGSTCPTTATRAGIRLQRGKESNGALRGRARVLRSTCMGVVTVIAAQRIGRQNSQLLDIGLRIDLRGAMQHSRHAQGETSVSEAAL